MRTSTAPTKEAKTLGALLGQLRQASELSLEDVADEADIQLWKVAQYEAGECPDLSRDDLQKIVGCYRFTADLLIAAVGLDTGCLN